MPPRCYICRKQITLSGKIVCDDCRKKYGGQEWFEFLVKDVDRERVQMRRSRIRESPYSVSEDVLVYG